MLASIQRESGNVSGVHLGRLTVLVEAEVLFAFIVFFCFLKRAGKKTGRK